MDYCAECFELEVALAILFVVSILVATWAICADSQVANLKREKEQREFKEELIKELKGDNK